MRTYQIIELTPEVRKAARFVAFVPSRDQRAGINTIGCHAVLLVSEGGAFHIGNRFHLHVEVVGHVAESQTPLVVALEY